MARAARQQTRPRAVGHTLASPSKQSQPLQNFHPYQTPPRPAATPIPMQNGADSGYESNFDLAALDFSTPNPYNQPSSPYDFSSYANSTTPESLSGSFQQYPQPLPSWSHYTSEDRPDDYDSLCEHDAEPVQPTPKSKGKSRATDPTYIPRPRNAFMLYRSDLVALVKEGKIPEAFVQATNSYQEREKERLEGESAAKVASGSSPSDNSEGKPRKKPSKPKPNAQPVAPETEEILGKGRTGGNVPQSTQSKILSIMWKDFVSPSEKKVWYAKALKEKEEHAKKYPGYKFQPKSKATKERESEERRWAKEEAKSMKTKKGPRRDIRKGTPLVAANSLARPPTPPSEHRSYPFPMPALSLPSLGSDVAPSPFNFPPPPPPHLEAHEPVQIHYEPVPPPGHYIPPHHPESLDARYLGGFPIEHSLSSDSWSSYSQSLSSASDNSSYHFMWENPNEQQSLPGSRDGSANDDALNDMADLSWMANLGFDETFQPQGLVPVPVQYELVEGDENLTSFFSEDTDMATARPTMPAHGSSDTHLHTLQDQQSSPARNHPYTHSRNTPSRSTPHREALHYSTPTRHPEYPPLYDHDSQLLAMGMDDNPDPNLEFLDPAPMPVSIKPIHPITMTEHLNQRLGPTLTSAQLMSPIDSSFGVNSSTPVTARYVSNSKFPDSNREKERGWLARSPSVGGLGVGGFPSIMESSGFGELGEGDIFDWEEGAEEREGGDKDVSPGKDGLGKAAPGLAARGRAVGKKFTGPNIEVGTRIVS